MLKSDREVNEEAAREHKISWAEAARRENDTFEKVKGSGRVDQQERLFMAYRSALYSQIDTGQLTPEIAKYQLEEKKLAIISYKDEQQRQAFANLAVAGLGMMQAQPAPSPFVNCTSTALGNTVNTMCH